MTETLIYVAAMLILTIGLLAAVYLIMRNAPTIAVAIVATARGTLNKKAPKLLIKDEEPRIAANIAKLPNCCPD